MNVLNLRSLQTRVTLFTFAISLLAIWSLAFYASSNLRASLQSLLEDQQYSTVTMLASDINQQLTERLQAVEDVAQSITPAVLGDTASMQKFLEQRTDIHGLFNAGLFVTRKDGNPIADVPVSANRLGRNVRERDYMIAALNEGRSSIGQPVMGKSLRSPVFSIAAPIRDANQNVTGVLVGVINLQKPTFLDKIGESRYGKTGSYLLNSPKHRLIVTTSDKGRTMEKLPAPGVNPMVDRYINGYEGSMVGVNPVGVEVLASAKRIPVSGWYLAAQLPVEEAFNPIADMERRVMLAALWFTALAAALTWWMIQRQLAPMRSAVQVLAKQAGTSEPMQPLPIRRFDEVGQLIGGFNNLLQALTMREEALKNSEAAARQAMNEARLAVDQLNLQRFALDQHAIVAITDVKGIISYANDKFVAISGFQREELLGHDHAILNSGVHSEGFFKDMYNHISRGEVWHGDVCNRTKNGSLYWMQTTVVPVMKDGKPDQYIAIRADITERKAMALELAAHQERLEDLVKAKTRDLRHSEARFRSLVENLNDVLFTLSVTGEITYVSPQWKAAYGHEPSMVLGHTLISFLHPEDIAPWGDFLQRVKNSGTQQQGVEYRVLCSDARYRWTSANATLAIDPVDGTAQFLGIGRDVTERKKMDEELMLAKSVADTANRAKSDFLARMSHEIRTPMNGVIGMVDILHETNLQAEQQRMLDTIQKSSLSLLQILNDILDFSKIEAGKLEVESVPTDVHEIVQSTAELMLATANSRLIELSVRVAPDVPRWIVSDPTRLRQILLNLLGNAFKFTCKGDGLTGRVNLHVASCALADGGTGIQLRVMDNGIGMSTEVLENLFQPFTQADDGIARKFGGTGLGLSICQRLVALLNGKISVVSQLGEGSVFTVELPLIPCEPAVLPAPTPGAQFVQSDCSTQADHANRLILLAEDNETNQEVIQEQLRILGYACEIADDGEAALRLWRSGRFALLLTDCNMPIMDGFELTEAIRRSERQGVRSPIIAVTANAMQGEAMRCLERGMDDYLCKPMRIDALAAMLTKWLAPMQTARADRRPDGHTTAS